MEKVRELQVKNVLTESGKQVQKGYRETFKKQVENKLLDKFVKQDDGSYTYDLIQDTSGKIVRARVEMTISIKEDFSKKGSEPVETDLPEIELF